MNLVFENFFSVGHISVGPTIISQSVLGNYLGAVQIYSTKKDIFLKNKLTSVGIRDYDNMISEDLSNAFKYLSIDKNEFDYFINNLFILEWESISNKIKPDISNLKKRHYI